MAPIFATADIAALVAAFPPPAPTMSVPGLLRSLSGNNLKDSRKVMTRFRTLLETAPSRIRLVDLPSRLDVADTDWLLDEYDSLQYYSRDGQSLIPKPLADEILNDILTRLQQTVLNVNLLLTELNISVRSLNNLLAREPDQDEVEELIDEDVDRTRYLYSRSYAAKILESIKSTVAHEQSEGIDLNQRFPDVPTALLKELADTAMSGKGAERGSFRVVNERVVFIPSSYAASLEEKQRAARDRQVQKLVDRLRDDGHCRIPAETGDGDGMLQAVMGRFSEQSSDSITGTILNESRSTILALSSRLAQTQETLRLAAPQETARIWHSRDGSSTMASLTEAAIASLQSNLNSDLALLLLHTPYRAEASSIITSTLARLEAEDTLSFSQTIREHLLAPITLYANGIATVTEPTLHQHLEEYLGEHFRLQALPAFTTLLREQRLHLPSPNTKSRKRDLEKMQAACAEAKTLSDVQAAVTKLAKKQKVDPPSSEQLQLVQQRTLQQKVKAMRKMTRGSDLLQNLVWILLAAKTAKSTSLEDEQQGQSDVGLFMSAGRDTSRMVKLCQPMGDAETGRRLEAWRDMLKAGKEQKQDLQEMRELAAKSLEEAFGMEGEAVD